jgi:hypothetical protein
LLKIGYTDIFLQITINERRGDSRDMEDEDLEDFKLIFRHLCLERNLLFFQIKCAAGKRPDEAGQKAIMGNVPATAVRWHSVYFLR